LYRVTDELNAYATISRGFKAGGFNADFVGNSDLKFNPETVTNYEGGLKYAGDRLQIDAAGYYMDYRNLQVSTFVPFVGFVITNAATARVTGAEFDLTALPFDGLTITSGLGYNDATFVKYRDGTGGVFDGNQLPYAPHWTFNVSAEYAYPVYDEGSLRLFLEYTDRSNYFSRSSNDPIFLVSGYGLLNGRLSFDSADNHWSVQLWGRNLADKLYVNDRDQPFGGLLGQTSVSYGMPRTFGVDLLVHT
jgi:iron complex outermembrane receptor protein